MRPVCKRPIQHAKDFGFLLKGNEDHKRFTCKEGRDNQTCDFRKQFRRKNKEYLLCSWVWVMINNRKLTKKNHMDLNEVMNHAVKGHPGQTGHGREFWQNVVHWRREWQTTPVFLPQESRTVWKGNMIRHWKVSAEVSRCPTYYEESEKQLQKEWRGWGKVETMLSSDV